MAPHGTFNFMCLQVSTSRENHYLCGETTNN